MCVCVNCSWVQVKLVCHASALSAESPPLGVAAVAGVASAAVAVVAAVAGVVVVSVAVDVSVAVVVSVLAEMGVDGVGAGEAAGATGDAAGAVFGVAASLRCS